MGLDRKKEVIDTCLKHFIDKGVSEATTRSLSNALQLQNAGIYYYFSNKDEAVLQCAEEAAIRLENGLILPAINDISNIDEMMASLKKRAEEMSNMMKFLVTVSASRRYNEQMRPILDRASHRYSLYAEKVAKKLNCSTEEIAPYLFMGITAVTNYMIFNDASFIVPQIDIIKTHLSKIMSQNGDLIKGEES